MPQRRFSQQQPPGSGKGASPGDEAGMVDAVLPRGLDPAEILVGLLARPCPEAAELVASAKFTTCSSTFNVVEHLHVVSRIDPTVLWSTARRHIGGLKAPSNTTCSWDRWCANQDHDGFRQVSHLRGSPELSGQVPVQVQPCVLSQEVQHLRLALRVGAAKALQTRSGPSQDKTLSRVRVKVAEEYPRQVRRDVLCDLHAEHPVKLPPQSQRPAQVSGEHQPFRDELDVRRAVKRISLSDSQGP
eukprot:UN1629